MTTALFISGADLASGLPTIAEAFDSDEGNCHGEIICDCQLLDGLTLTGDDYAILKNCRYGHGNDEVPPRSLPETGGKCFVSWATDLAEGWYEYTPEQRNQAFVIANQVYPDSSLFAELEDRL